MEGREESFSRFDFRGLDELDRMAYDAVMSSEFGRANILYGQCKEMVGDRIRATKEKMNGRAKYNPLRFIDKLVISDYSATLRKYEGLLDRLESQQTKEGV